MNQRTDRLTFAMIVALAAALVWIVSGTLADPVVNAGDKAPDFKVSADNGRAYSKADFGGKLLVLNFWATWCPPCVQEVPSLEAFQQTMAADGVVVLGVSVDTNERNYKEFLKRFRVNFPTARDPEWSISSRYGTFQFPETYLIDRNGKVVEKIIAGQNWMDPAFLAHVKTLL